MTSKSSFSLWSATPTPFHEDLSPDVDAVVRLVERHIHLGVDGLFLGGSCGEGPWMPMEDLERITRIAKEAAGERIRIAVQATDNSARRVLGHIERFAQAGAEYAVMASPYFLMNAGPDKLLRLYLEIIRQSPLPIGFYDRGQHSPHSLPADLLPEILAEPNLKLIKDSSGDADRRKVFLEAGRWRADLKLFTGNEFHCIGPLQAGYRGLLLGGGIFNARLAKALCAAVEKGETAEAERIQERMNALMYRVYGGEKIACWLAGLKYLLVELGTFSGPAHYLGYPLTSECKAAIDEILHGADADAYRPELVVSH